MLNHTKPIFVPAAHTGFSTHFHEYFVCIFIKRALVVRAGSSEFKSASEEKNTKEIVSSAPTPLRLVSAWGFVELNGKAHNFSGYQKKCFTSE